MTGVNPGQLEPTSKQRTNDSSGERRDARSTGSTGLTDVSVIIPTFNESGNILTLLDRLATVLGTIDHEIIVVDDDSPDRTWQLVANRATIDPRVRLVRRIGRRGLSSAVLEGMDAARGSVLAVMDADLQHDERVLPQICTLVLDGDADVCVGSRQAPGGSYGEFGPVRRLVSFVGAQLARPFLGVAVTDPMSGYFALSRERLDIVRPEINPRGFKILLDVLAHGPKPRVGEVGYGFRARREGETKLTGSVMGSFVVAIAALALSRTRSRLRSRIGAGRRSQIANPVLAEPPTFIVYVGVAVSAIGLRSSLVSLVRGAGFGDVIGLLATEVSVLAEFVAHNQVTFEASDTADEDVLERLGRFHLVAFGAILVQYGLAAWFEGQLRGLAVGQNLVPVFVASTAGLMATMVGAYRLNKALTWRSVSSISSNGR